jgi:4,5-dihydroxyphthalate decarboxylase
MPYSCSLIDSALTRPILDGAVSDPSLDITFTAATVDENSRAMIAGKLDVAEMSMATHVQARDRGLDLIAIPVFMGRRFLQPCVAFARSTKIGSPAELRGKRIGLPQFWMTSSMWHRGLLEHEYGVPATQVEWVTTQPERLDAGFSPGAGVKNVGDHPLSQLPELLDEGTVDVLFAPRPLPRDGKLSFLFDDPVKTSLEYRARTGIYPLLHTIVLKSSLAAKAPALFELFRRSKAYAYEHPGAVEIESPIAGLDFEQARKALGDPYPLGIAANADALEAFLTYSAEQALTQKRVNRADAWITLE